MNTVRRTGTMLLAPCTPRFAAMNIRLGQSPCGVLTGTARRLAVKVALLHVAPVQ